MEKKLAGIPSCGNIFIDLGFPEPEARVLLMRAQLMIEIRKHIEAQNWTHAETAKHMDISVTRLSKLLKRASDEFSLDMLLTLAARIGIRSELKLAA